MGGWAIAVHGGAGVDPNLPQERQEEAKKLLARCLDLGISALRSNLPAIDVVELVVRHPSLSIINFLQEVLFLFSTIVNKQAKKKLHINPRFFLVYKHARN
jgi:hypothetical protein